MNEITLLISFDLPEPFIKKDQEVSADIKIMEFQRLFNSLRRIFLTMST